MTTTHNHVKPSLRCWPVCNICAWIVYKESTSNCGKGVEAILRSKSSHNLFLVSVWPKLRLNITCIARFGSITSRWSRYRHIVSLQFRNFGKRKGQIPICLSKAFDLPSLCSVSYTFVNFEYPNLFSSCMRQDHFYRNLNCYADCDQATRWTSVIQNFQHSYYWTEVGRSSWTLSARRWNSATESNEQTAFAIKKFGYELTPSVICSRG